MKAKGDEEFTDGYGRHRQHPVSASGGAAATDVWRQPAERERKRKREEEEENRKEARCQKACVSQAIEASASAGLPVN